MKFILKEEVRDDKSTLAEGEFVFPACKFVISEKQQMIRHDKTFQDDGSNGAETTETFLSAEIDAMICLLTYTILTWTTNHEECSPGFFKDATFIQRMGPVAGAKLHHLHLHEPRMSDEPVQAAYLTV